MDTQPKQEAFAEAALLYLTAVDSNEHDTQHVQLLLRNGHEVTGALIEVDRDVLAAAVATLRRHETLAYGYDDELWVDLLEVCGFRTRTDLDELAHKRMQGSK